MNELIGCRLPLRVTMPQTDAGGSQGRPGPVVLFIRGQVAARWRYALRAGRRREDTAANELEIQPSTALISAPY
jgi:hypothetical protein